MQYPVYRDIFFNDLYVILIGRAFLGVSIAGIMTVSTTLVGDYFEDEERVAFMGVQSAFISLGGVFFISIAGVLADNHWRDPFLIYLFSLPVFFMVIRYIVEPEREGSSSSKKDADHPPQSDIGAHHYQLRLYFLYALMFVSMVVVYMVPVQIPYLFKSLGLSGAVTGFSIGTMTLSAAIVSSNYRRIKKNASFPLIFAISFALMAVGCLIVAYSNSLWQYLCGFVAIGFGSGFFMPSVNLWAMAMVPEAIRGRVIGRMTAAIFMGTFFSPILTHPFVTKLGPSSAFIGAAVVNSMLCALVFSLRKKLI